ncbi:RNA pseudouridylate synthase domain-containing protein 1 [Porphyridium purpureum]|uniref:RNA pseudouridylate synthase domain-containing protein 1 n=1 Tax=Porphyridium purpureum TaxID=35688 RepID=A0A5J4YP60_PORPP|nr:RNA pseudouridylate synthase domain-containing protein 1 [Porphyridium purpureum]|eukprot:POR1712..scf296_7
MATRARAHEPVIHTAGRVPPAAPQFSVIYESDTYVCVNKPFDVRVDGEHEHTVDKFVAARLRDKLDEASASSPLKPRLVHQLDYSTSGVMLMALTRQAANYVARQFETRATKKAYLALVYGSVCDTAHVVNRAIGATDGFEMRLVDETDSDAERSKAKAATTHVYALSEGFYRGQPAAKLLLVPITGRRHQLRLHCQSLGHTIIGDATYGQDSHWPLGDPRNPERMYLHAYMLAVDLSLSASAASMSLLAAPDPFIGVLEDERTRLSEKDLLQIFRSHGLVDASRGAVEDLQGIRAAA